jgi:hypothetical protein
MAMANTRRALTLAIAAAAIWSLATGGVASGKRFGTCPNKIYPGFADVRGIRANIGCQDAKDAIRVYLNRKCDPISSIGTTHRCVLHKYGYICRQVILSDGRIRVKCTSPYDPRHPRLRYFVAFVVRYI